MNKIILLASLVTSALAFTPVVKADDDVSLRICEYVAANDKNRLRSYLKQNKLKIRQVYSNIQCNGKNLLIFAAVNNALETGEFLLGQVSVKEVEENIPEIAKYSKHLEAEAKKRIQ